MIINIAENSGLSEKLQREIIFFAKKNNIDKLVLFGSRARGDFSPRSDIDLAVWGGNGASFVTDIDEETNTLLMFDVVDFKYSVQIELKDSILKEGFLLYEKV